jgi:hypothetical protein
MEIPERGDCSETGPTIRIGASSPFVMINSVCRPAGRFAVFNYVDIRSNLDPLARRVFVFEGFWGFLPVQQLEGF